MPYFPDPSSTVSAVTVDGLNQVGPPSGSSTGIVVRPVTQSVSSSFSVVSSSLSVVQLLPVNPERIGCAIFNDSTKVLSLRLAPSGSGLNSDFTVRMAANSYFELPEPVYTGGISGLWNAVNGVARLTEYT